MYISNKIYYIPPDETVWWAMKTPHGDKEEYYLYRVVNEKKERVFLGKTLHDKNKIKSKISEHESKKNYPPHLRTSFKDFVLVEVLPKQNRRSPKNMDPSKTTWIARRLKNGSIYGYYLYRQIGRKKERVYLGVELDLITAKNKIAKAESALNLAPEFRTNLDNFELEVSDTIP